MLKSYLMSGSGKKGEREKTLNYLSNKKGVKQREKEKWKTIRPKARVNG